MVQRYIPQSSNLAGWILHCVWVLELPNANQRAWSCWAWWGEKKKVHRCLRMHVHYIVCWDESDWKCIYRYDSIHILWLYTTYTIYMCVCTNMFFLGAYHNTTWPQFSNASLWKMRARASASSPPQHRRAMMPRRHNWAGCLVVAMTRCIYI
jgi:hypothetical protein